MKVVYLYLRLSFVYKATMIVTRAHQNDNVTRCYNWAKRVIIPMWNFAMWSKFWSDIMTNSPTHIIVPQHFQQTLTVLKITHWFDDPMTFSASDHRRIMQNYTSVFRLNHRKFSHANVKTFFNKWFWKKRNVTSSFHTYFNLSYKLRNIACLGYKIT